MATATPCGPLFSIPTALISLLPSPPKIALKGKTGQIWDHERIFLRVRLCVEHIGLLGVAIFDRSHEIELWMEDDGPWEERMLESAGGGRQVTRLEYRDI